MSCDNLFDNLFDNLDNLFEIAVNEVNGLKIRPSDDFLLNLYGLYKQSIEGNNRSPKPSILDFKGKAKWNAWNIQKGKGKNTSKKQYIQLVNNLV
jgi:diazepam-binding inhibitor (GABA receptor modulating acyl-CoA-binding protein)